MYLICVDFIGSEQPYDSIGRLVLNFF